MVRPEDGAVDHLDRLADPFGVVQHLEQPIPEAGERPAAKLAMITRPAAAVRTAGRHEGLEELL